MRNNLEIYTCDLCKKEFPLYPPPNSLVVRHIIKGDNIIPDICQECENAVSDFLDTLRK